MSQCFDFFYLYLFERGRKSNRNSGQDFHSETNIVIGDSVRGPLACLWPLPMAVAQEGIKMSRGNLLCLTTRLTNSLPPLPAQSPQPSGPQIVQSCTQQAPLPPLWVRQSAEGLLLLSGARGERTHTHTQWNPVDVKGVWSSRGFAVWVCGPDHD